MKTELHKLQVKTQKQVAELRKLFGATARQKLMLNIAERVEPILEQVTANNIGNDRWHLSGMAFPRHSTHTVDKSWQTTDVTPESLEWTNHNPIYRFLDKGTAAHGPKRAKMLFIPLNEQTALAYLNGELSLGEDGVTTPYDIEQNQISKKTGKYTRKKLGKILDKTITNKKLRRRMAKQGRRVLEWGKDFVLTKRVKGISARRITEQIDQMVKPFVRHEINAYVGEAMNRVREASR